MLIGPDGIAKKIAVHSRADQIAGALQRSREMQTPRCMKAGIDYYTATFSFDQALSRSIRRDSGSCMASRSGCASTNGARRHRRAAQRSRSQNSETESAST